MLAIEWKSWQPGDLVWDAASLPIIGLMSGQENPRPGLAGRQVFDGILPVVAGSRRTCINWQFAQAGRYSRQHEDHSYGDDQFPFSYPTLTDPVSGRSGGILQRARDAGVCP